EGAPAIVDIRNGSGNPAAAAELASRLRTAGMQVGAVTTTGATTSAVLHPDAQRPQAGVLAAALGLAGSAQLAAVDHVTVVIGAQDSDRVFATPSIC
ncbi:MAG TPA: LytR C-terminal domain-containing protein, partial [Blastococcus sp.]